MMRAPWLLLLLGGSALAAPVHGTVKFPDEARPEAPPSGYWRVENGILPVTPAESRGDAVLVLEPATPSKADPPTSPSSCTGCAWIRACSPSPSAPPSISRTPIAGRTRSISSTPPP